MSQKFYQSETVLKLPVDSFQLFLSREVQIARSFEGALGYMSPQVIKGEGYSYKTDVWSVGLVFIVMMILKPFFDVVKPALFAKLDPGEIPGVPDHFQALRNCICRKMIVLKEDDRASVQQVIDDVAFRNHFPTVEGKALDWNDAVVHEAKANKIVSSIEAPLHSMKQEITVV